MEGFNVIVAPTSWKQALDLLDDSIDLLLLDVMMPINGIQHIKSTSPDTPDACHYVDGARQ